MLIFEKIIPNKNQINNLYFLLTNRKHSISHNKIPSFEEHSNFVSQNPYLKWYLISKEKKTIGSVYIQSDNSIGIDFIDPKKKDIIEIILFIKNNHKPLAKIKSTRRGEFFVNIASNNLNLIKILNSLNKKEIQRSFVI